MMHKLELIPFRLLLDRVIDPIRQHWRSLFLPTAVPLLFLGVGHAVLQNFFLLPNGDDLDAAISDFFIGCIALPLMFLTLVGYMLVFSAQSICCLDALAGRQIDWRRAWGLLMTPRMFFTLFLVVALSMISLLLCLVPALYVVPILALVMPVMIEEQRFGGDALRRSVELSTFNPNGSWMQGPWIHILLLLFVGWLIGSALGFLVQMPIIVIQQLMAFRETVGGGLDDPTAFFQFGWWQVPLNALNALVLALSWCYPNFAMALMFHELKRRQEGADLEQAIHQLRQQVDPPTTFEPA